MINPHPYYAAMAGYTMASTQLIAVVSPASLGEYFQALNVGLMVLGSTLIILWQRKQEVIRKDQAEKEQAKHAEVLAGQATLASQMDAARLALVAVEVGKSIAMLTEQLQASKQDREMLKEQLQTSKLDRELLHHQLTELGERTAGLKCPQQERGSPPHACSVSPRPITAP